VPKQVDHEQRRGQLAEALWRITARDGLDAASVRQVAQEAGVSPGLVQHYFSTKDDMLSFAMERIGTDLGARLTAKVGSLAEPRDPREVIRIVLLERLPFTPQGRVYAQAAVAWLGRAVLRPELTEYLVTGTRVLRDYLADQIQRGQLAGQFAPSVPAVRAADSLLAFSDGLASQMLSGIHDNDSAELLVDQQLRLLDFPR
jgi:AcrR family transcriptional regulator